MEKKRALENTLGNKKYAGNPWTCFQTGWHFMLLMIFPAIFIQKAAEYPVLYTVSFIACAAIFYITSSLQLNYFMMEGKMLIIKNHFNFDEYDALQIDEVAEMEIINMPRGPKALKIVGRDKKEEISGAASLRKKHWEALKKDIATHNIMIKDDGRTFYGR